MDDTTVRIPWFDTRKDDFQTGLAELRRKLSPRGDVVSDAGRRRTIQIFGEPLAPNEVVQRICSDVANRGLEAVLDYSQRIDGAKLGTGTLRIPAEQMADAHARIDRKLLETIRRVQQNIAEFQSAILHSDERVERRGGYLIERYRPLRRVGVCVPGGAAAYPSTLLMTVVPAQMAGVEQIAVVAPPTEFGAFNPDVQAICYELGIEELYAIGGAQAVAMLAYGVEGISQVDKIVGPGNLFVALAKKHVFGEVDIDSIAGPSEVVVIIDEHARPEFTAYDLLAQAEHSPGASVLIGWDERSLRATLDELSHRIARLQRGDLAKACLEEFGAVIQAQSPEEACDITEAIAPEHLHIATANAAELAEQIRNAGAIFLGNYTPVAAGDYAAGPSHVLPTSGTARFAGALSANDFLKPTSILCFDKKGLQSMAEDICRLAEHEGLTAHKASVEIRMADDEKEAPGK